MSALLAVFLPVMQCIFTNCYGRYFLMISNIAVVNNARTSIQNEELQVLKKYTVHQF